MKGYLCPYRCMYNYNIITNFSKGKKRYKWGVTIRIKSLCNHIQTLTS